MATSEPKEGAGSAEVRPRGTLGWREMRIQAVEMDDANSEASDVSDVLRTNQAGQRQRAMGDPSRKHHQLSGDVR